MDKALATQLANIEKRSGKSLDALAKIVRASGLTRHGEIRDMLKRDLGMGHGDANTLVHHVLKSDGPSAAEAAGKSPTAVVLTRSTRAPKAPLRPIHDQLMARDRHLRPFRDRPEEGLRQPSAQEAVRDDRPGHEHPRGRRPEHEGRCRRPNGSWRCLPAACVSTR